MDVKRTGSLTIIAMYPRLSHFCLFYLEALASLKITTSKAEQIFIRRLMNKIDYLCREKVFYLVFFLFACKMLILAPKWSLGFMLQKESAPHLRDCLDRQRPTSIYIIFKKIVCVSIVVFPLNRFRLVW